MLKSMQPVPISAPIAEEPKSRSATTKVGFVSLGCPKNLVDSEVMMGILAASGAEITPDANQADVIVVNTCSFIDTAKQESVDTILQMAQHKKSAENPGGRAQKLIVAGCLVERYRNEIQKNIPEVDAVVGTGELEGILAAAGIETRSARAQESPFNILTSRPESTYSRPGAPQTSRAEGDARERSGRFSKNEWDGAIADLPNYLYTEATPRILTTPGHMAYIKIAEAERLVQSGVRELTLIGQDTTCYGEDLGLKDGLALLLERLAKIPNMQWVRFLYAYPNKITGKLLETIASNPKICSYIDVPLQHASGNVLKRMKRGANAEIFLKSIRKMRKIIPNLTLRTSFIVGFPGETEADFEELVSFVKAAELDWLGVFGYSDEEGAGAFAMDQKIAPKEIERRRKKLMNIQQQISRRKKSGLIGRQFDVVLEGPSEETDLLWEGRTEMHAPEIDGKVFINDFGDYDEAEIRKGRFFRCEITEAHDYDVVAKLV
jgi:ribosomal protein S12 methylthiotransferase